MNKVIHCITTIERGGAENQLLILIKEQINVGKKVIILYLKGEPTLKQDFLDAGAEVLDILYKKPLLIQILVMYKFIKKEGYILHAHLPRAELISAATCKKNKLIISRHNSEKFFPRAPKFLSSFLSILVTNKASACIAISESVKNHILSNKEILSKDKIEVVYYGYDIKFPNNNYQKTRHTQFTIGTIGRLVEQKDQKTLLKAFAEFLRINSNSKLIIVGEGNLKGSLIDLAKRLNILDKILWSDKTNNVADYLLKMDIFVLPSRYEGFGLVLLEAMQLSIPIVAANNSAIPEVLGLNYPGLFETSDAEDLLKKIALFHHNTLDINFSSIFENNLSRFNPIFMEIKIDGIYNSNLENFNSK